jgi:hypothetical protein
VRPFQFCCGNDHHVVIDQGLLGTEAARRRAYVKADLQLSKKADAMARTQVWCSRGRRD